MKEGFIKLDGQDRPQKSFYDSLPKANKKTLKDMPKTVKHKASILVTYPNTISFSYCNFFIKDKKASYK